VGRQSRWWYQPWRVLPCCARGADGAGAHEVGSGLKAMGTAEGEGSGLTGMGPEGAGLVGSSSSGGSLLRYAFCALAVIDGNRSANFRARWF